MTRLPAKINPELARLLEKQLDKQESLIWSGQPDPARSAKLKMPEVLSGIFIIGFSIFWICGAAGFKIPDFKDTFTSIFPLFGIPILGSGIFMLTSPARAYRRALGTIYAVTNKRLMIISQTGSSKSLRSYTEKDLTMLERREHANGTGDLVFAQNKVDPTDFWQVMSSGNSKVQDVGFFGISDALSVERHVLQNFKKNNIQNKSPE